MTTSDLRDVWTTWGKCNFIPRSTFISRDCAACKRFFLVFLGEAGFSPSSMNWMYEADLTWVWHFFRLSCYKMSASAQRTCSWCHPYLPWLSAVLHPARMCANVPLPPHRLHSESYLIHHLCRFVGVGRVSYIDRSRKEMRKGSSFQSSCHMIFLFGRSHLVQAPCDQSSTAFDHRLSSSRCQTSAWIISLLCLGSAFPIVGSGWSRVLVCPCTGSQWCPSTSAYSQPVPLMCQLPTCVLILWWYLYLWHFHRWSLILWWYLYLWHFHRWSLCTWSHPYTLPP